MMPPDRSETISPIDLASTPRFRIGPLTIAPSLREVSGADWAEILEPRVMQVLVALSARASEVVTRDELVTRCWNGLAVGEDAIQRCIGRLRRLARDRGSFEIATIPRVGYRLLPDEGAAHPVMAAPASPPSHTQTSPVVVDVEPFSILTEDETTGSFATILFDEIVIALTLCRDFVVRLAGPAQKGGYRLSGSLRPAAGHMQASLRIVDGDDVVVFARKFETGWAGEPAPNEEFVLQVSGALTSEILRTETERALRKSSDLTAWEAVVRSVSAYSSINSDNLDFAITEARRALRIDPGYAEAHAALANALAGKFEVCGGLDKALAEEAAREIDLALKLGRDRPDVLARAATALSMIGRCEEALPYAERAVELNPCGPIGHLYLGRVLMRNGRPEKAAFHLSRFEQLSPNSALRYFSTFQRSVALFMMGKLAEAATTLDQAISLNPEYPFSWLSKAVLKSHQGEIEEAVASIDRLAAIEGQAPLSFHLARIRAGYPDERIAGALTSAFEQAWQAALAAQGGGS